MIYSGKTYGILVLERCFFPTLGVEITNPMDLHFFSDSTNSVLNSSYGSVRNNRTTALHKKKKKCPLLMQCPYLLFTIIIIENTFACTRAQI